MLDFFTRLAARAARDRAMDAAVSGALPTAVRYALCTLFIVLLAAASGFCVYLAWSYEAGGVPMRLLLLAVAVLGVSRLIGFIRRILRGQ